MNVDHILETMNRNEVNFILIGGMNFLLRHVPMLTFDVDLWIEDTERNRANCERALGLLVAEWGRSDKDWKSVSKFPAGWLNEQHVFCLTSPHGPIDIFRSVKGLDSWQGAKNRSLNEKTAAGISYSGLCDEDMLQCQLALDPKDQNAERIKFLKSHSNE
jgi:hypothetical protein